MTRIDLIALAPYLVIAATAVIAMLAVAVRRNHLLTAAIGIGGLALAFCFLFVGFPFLPRQVTALLILDQYAYIYLGLIIVSGITVALFAYGYLEKSAALPEEFYLLLMTAVFGAAVLTAAAHFASVVLGLETLSVSLYALAGYLRRRERGIEAALKYLVTAAVSSAFMVFGMALLYAEFGVMDVGGLAGRAAAAGGLPVMLAAGTALIVTGLGFKLALVPFHLWTPDVYEGAPAPVTAFIATASKGAVFALLLRWFGGSSALSGGVPFAVFSIIAVASMFTGNLLALLQANVKRMLAYSSIAHMGYLLVAFLASGPLAAAAVTFYLAAYFVTTLGAFGIVILLSDEGGEADTLDHYRSLARRRPWIAGAFVAMLLSLAGIPLTAGFVGKFIVAAAGAESALWPLLAVLVINSAIGLFYYLRVGMVMFEPLGENAGDGGGQEGEGGAGAASARLSPTGQAVLAILLVLLVWLGVYPGPLLEMFLRLPMHP